MISVILNAGEDHKALSRLLTALVPAAAEGLIREVAVLGAAGLSYDVADDAGADLYDAGDFAGAFARTHGPWVAGLPLAAEFVSDWIDALGMHLSRTPAEPAQLVRRGFGLAPRPEGWLVPKALAPLAAARPREQDLQRLARRSGRRLRILRRA